MYCVDLGESFQMSFYLQKSASIQPSIVSIVHNRLRDREVISHKGNFPKREDIFSEAKEVLVSARMFAKKAEH